MDFDGEIKAIKKTNIKQCVHCNTLSVEVGTTGLQGGDWSHGSRAYIKLKDQGGTAWAFRINGQVFEPREIEILIGGDAELETFREALEFAATNI